MSVLIEGMEMPTRCAECRLSTVHSFNDRPLCDVLVEYMSYGEWEAKRLDRCPLIEVPEPHGRLIDADELIEFIENRYEITWKDDYEGGIKDACVDILEKISTMSTVIQTS